MKKIRLIVFGILAGNILAVGLLWLSANSSVKAESAPAAQSASATPTATIFLVDDGAGAGALQPDTGDDEVPPSGFESLLQSAVYALPTPIPGQTQLFFVPTDNDATATVLYLYNTDTVSHIVALRGFSYNGVLVYALNISVNAQSFKRLASDSIASAPPPSWATPAPIITNFTDFTYFACLSLPKGVKVEGYTLYNPGTGVVDPRKDQGAVPLRFSTDPYSLFLPAVSN